MSNLIKCNRCSTEFIPTYKANGKAMKGCGRCRDVARAYRKSHKCCHGNQIAQCKPCGGSQICTHGHRISYCNPCGGSQICTHGRRISVCKPCGGSEICMHERERSSCKPCGDALNITIKTMITGGRVSDIKYNRLNIDQLITPDYVRGLIDQSLNNCCYCNITMQYITYDATLATIERIDNSIGHIIGNCKIACRTCNFRKVGNKILSRPDEII